ncbi:MAG: class I SAM-dependent methyltransferase [Candidatus Dojkabacteria bacterium]|nr:class I SAM-dependent methyltransferase [Candidatus Dojkabacteria bacterium]
MPNGLALAVSLIVVALTFSYVVTVFLSLVVSSSHTNRKELKNLVKKMNLKDGDVFADLGCGDGRVVFEVAKYFKNVKCIGYEISPIYIMIAKLSKMVCFPFSKRVQIIPEDFTKADLSEINVFYINWGHKTTEKNKNLKETLKKRKNVKVIEV